MSETKYLKCSCQKCGASIEFPIHGTGSVVPCPHCGERTTLFVPPTVGSSAATPASEVTPATPPVGLVGPTDELAEASEGFATTGGRRGSGALPLSISVVLLILIGGAVFVFRNRFTRPELADSKVPVSVETTKAPTGKESESVQTASSALAAKTPKSADDLKVGDITLEKAKGSSVVYAVGVLRNESDHQRFGVNIEVELADAKGAKAGVAKDYRSVVEPRQEWRFRALVLDTKAVSAKLSRIREEE
jgi:hypothetical protein